MIRVAHLVSHPVDYFAPLYRELEARDGIDLTVFFYSDESTRPHFDAGFSRTIEWNSDHLSGYRSRICRSAARRTLQQTAYRPHLDLLREVFAGRYDVLWVHGYSHVTTWLAALLARTTGKRLLVREEQTLLRERSALRRAVKRPLLRLFFSGAYGLYIGEQNRRYFESYGIRDERLYAAPYCVDNAALQARAAELAPERDRIRREFGIGTDEPVILFCGKLSETKQPFRLLDAFAQVRERHRCTLLLAGDGSLRAPMEVTVRERGISDVVFAGFLSRDRVERAFAAADVVVLPSAGETWGLVVNEALNFALPVVVSDRVGCGADLVRDDWSGYVFRYDDTNALASSLERLVSDAELRSRFGMRGRELVAKYSIERCADGIVRACMDAVRAGSRAVEA